jgi:IclR family transcriptional regulator, acetate operon repressor
MMNGNDVYPGAQAVTRALALLKTFGGSRPEYTLGELAQATGLNKTTAHRILAALEQEEFVTRNPRTGAYRLGAELIALGSIAVRTHDLRTVARPTLEELAAATGETTTLEVLSQRQALVLDEVSSRFLVGTTQDVGSRLPLHATSTGKLLLAHAPTAEIEAVLAGPLAQLAPCTVTDPQALAAQLDAIRRAGYAVAQEELEPGFVAIAAPIHDAARTVIAAISVGGPSLRLHGERIAAVTAAVQEGARAISRQIGYRPG